jgi:hypothetical protein
MLNDVAGLVSRLKASLPSRWFGEKSPNLDAILTGLATPWSWLFGALGYVSSQTRLSTATDHWLDLLATDFLGPFFKRRVNETNRSFRSRISGALFREQATRSAVVSGIATLVGFRPQIFEPSRCGDTGAYGSPAELTPGIIACGLAYGIAGGWGSLALPWQFFLTVARPPVSGLANLAGYGVSAAGYCQGPIGYVSLSSLPGRVDDTEIQQTVRELLPLNATAWLRII